jgi:O-antigen ligase
MNEVSARAQRFGQLEVGVLAPPLLVLLAFVIASGNAHWFFWAGLWPSLAIPPLLVLLSLREPGLQLRVPQRSLPMLLALSGMALLAGVSAFAVDLNQISFGMWLSAYLSPVLIYLGFLTVPFRVRLTRAVWFAITIGALIPLTAGLLAYYKEWGIPSALDVLTSRYNLQRMAGYMESTYGNTGNTSALLALLAPAWLALTLEKGGGTLRALCAAALLVSFLHALIVESRTLLIVLLVMLPLIAIFYRMRIVAAIGGLLLVGGAFVLPLLTEGERALDMTVGAVQGQGSDQSVEERSDAMRLGLRLLMDNPALGVGPGNSIHVNKYTSAHQYWINQGAELGMLGLLLSVVLSVAVFWRFAQLLRRRADGGVDDLRFAGLAGASGYMLYGCIANMSLSASIVNIWIGLFAVMLALDDVRYLDTRTGIATPGRAP